MPFCIASNRKCKGPLEKLVSPKGGRLGRIEKVVMMSISVQKLCKDKGISLLSLAERSRLDLKRLQSIYRGQWTPSPNERERIAQALGTSSDEIVWEHSTPIQHFYGPD
jgi:lambda repressor-like predicted transcriptional regulator